MMLDRSIVSLEVKVRLQLGQCLRRHVEAPLLVFLELIVFSLVLQMGHSICLYIDIQLEKKPVDKYLFFCG